jgi:hypothetical protein
MISPPHCLHLLLSAVEVVLTEARTVALLVLVCNVVVLTDVRAVSLLALDSVKVV